MKPLAADWGVFGTPDAATDVSGSVFAVKVQVSPTLAVPVAEKFSVRFDDGRLVAKPLVFVAWGRSTGPRSV